MDIHTHSHLPERLDIIEVGRRRRWSDEEKLRIVTESLQSPRLVSATARRHGITRSHLMAWRRALKVERVAPETPPAFVPGDDRAGGGAEAQAGGWYGAPSGGPTAAW